MKTPQEIISNHLFLSENKGIKEFVRHFASGSSSAQKMEHGYFVVCERAEDVSVIRQQIMRELETVLSKSIPISGGISFYTLDQLGRNFCASLALSNNENVKNALPKFLLKPYVEITKQEKIVDLILNLFHFSAQGSSILAKQLLALLDVPLPPDLSIFDALMNALNVKKKRSYKDISDVFLKQILASFQASRVVLTRYARLQTLVWDFLQSDFWTLMENHQLTLPHKFLSGSVLWIAAPEYEFPLSAAKNFRPGDFLSSLVDDFLACILKIRENFFDVNEEIFIHQRTVLKSDENHALHGNLEHLSLYCAKNRYEFYTYALKSAQKKEKSALTFTGEFDAGMFQTTKETGGGAYKLLKKDFSDWKAKKDDNFFVHEISAQLDKRYDDFLDTASYVENYPKLAEISKIYSIPIRDFSDAQLDEIFHSIVETESFEYKKDNTFAQLLKSYSFFSTPGIPDKLVVLWGSSHFEKMSFATRLINQVFSLLQSHGVDVDNPFTEKTFIGFWKHIIKLKNEFPPLKIEFIVDSPTSLENFPLDLKKQKFLPLPKESSLISNDKRAVLAIQKISDVQLHDSWLQSLFNQVQITQIATTQFESYVQCPFKFFLEHCVKLIPERSQEAFSVEPKSLGTKTHKICDLLLSRMVVKFGNDGYIEHVPALYELVLSALEPPDIFLSAEKQTWKTALSVLPHDERMMFFESVDEIFTVPAHDQKMAHAHDQAVSPRGLTAGPTHLSSVLFIEMVKRTFLKFLHTEIKTIQAGNKHRIGIAREYPFEIQLNGLTVRGRIDRIDMNKDGYEIIDYKTSSISKNKKSLCILPSEVQTKKDQGIPSIQGAIYALALGKKVFDNNTPELLDTHERHERENLLSAFSLYRLKNIKDEDYAVLTYSFAQNEKPLSGKEHIQLIENELAPYAENFMQRKFLPNPIMKKQTCKYCAFKNICPYQLRNGGVE